MAVVAKGTIQIPAFSYVTSFSGCYIFLNFRISIVSIDYYFSSDIVQNFDKLNIRTQHYTPIPAGCSPLKRPIDEYVR